LTGGALLAASASRRRLMNRFLIKTLRLMSFTAPLMIRRGGEKRAPTTFTELVVGAVETLQTFLAVRTLPTTARV
jgi:hypothetical protein